jgi:thiol-disulfide isomerase/thioredoxin
MKTKKLLATAVLAIAVGVPLSGFLGDISMSQPTTSTGIRVPFLHGLFNTQTADQSELASLERATEWLNSPPLTASNLRGKVVLVDFWTYTCINWLRTLPYVRAWHEKYRGQGLVVIGVHAPEFSFEKNPAMFASPSRTCGSITRSRSTTSMSSGAASGTTIGRRSISSMRKGASGISILVRAHMTSQR